MVLTLALAGCTSPPEPSGFSYKDLEGKTWSQGDLKGQVVVLYFWTASCGVCLGKLPELPELQAQLPEDVQLLLMNATDSKEVIRQLVGASGLTVLVNTMDSFKDYKIAYVPTTIFLDKEGKVYKTHVGLMADEEFLSIVEKLK